MVRYLHLLLPVLLYSENILHSLSEAGCRCVVVDFTSGGDANGHNPGLSDCMENRCKLEEALKETKISGVFQIGVGSRGMDDLAMMSSSSMDGVLDELSNRFDYVLIEAPSMERNVDSLMIAARCDMVLLIVRSCVASAEEISFVVRQFEAVSDHPVEFILNGFREEWRLK